MRRDNYNRMITVEIVEEPDKMKEYFAELDHMYDSGEYEASLSLEWTEALRKTHVEGAVFFLVVLKDVTELLGIVPLCIRKVKKQGLSLATLFPLAEYFNTHSDLLLKGTTGELVEVFLKALFDLRYNWDVFRINRFIESNPLLECIADKLQNSLGRHYRIRRVEPSFYIELGDSYGEYLNKRSSNFRNNIKRAAKKLRGLGEVSFRWTNEFHDFEEAYSIILAIEEESWKKKHGTAITSTKKQREFYRELWGGAYRKGRLRLCVLCLDQVPIAFEAGLLRGRKYYGVHGSYDEKFKKENPGTVLLARFLEGLVSDGVKEYDWFGEPFEWESRWTDTFRWHRSLLIYNNTMKARFFRVYNTLRDRLNHGGMDEIVLRDPRDIKPNIE